MFKIDDFDVFLFDFDGTIMNTEFTHYLSWKKVIQNYIPDFNISPDEYFKHIHSIDTQTFKNYLQNNYNITNYDELYKKKGEFYKEEIEKIEYNVNAVIEKKSDVKTRIMTPKEAVANGALALFGEKYGDEVRVLSMGDDGEKYFSTELCGGTHVKNTFDIGRFKIISQSAVASGIRRIEALRDKQLDEYLKNKEKLSTETNQKNNEIIKDLSKKIIELGAKPNIKNEDTLSLIKDLNIQLEQLKVGSILQDKSKNKITNLVVNKINVRFQNIQDLPFKDLRKLIDQGKKEIGEGLIIIYAVNDNKVGLAVGVTKTLENRFNAVEIVRAGSEIIGGKGGGGRADFAQAGGTLPNKIEESFENIKNLIN